jgi:hypothetical protein
MIYLLVVSFIRRANHSLIKLICVLPSGCTILYYMLGTHLLLQPHSLPHREQLLGPA